MDENSDSSKGYVYRYPVKKIGTTNTIPFVKYFRLLLDLPPTGRLLRRYNVCFQVCEYDDRVTLILNRTFEKADNTVKLFSFSGVWCLKLGTGFWRGLGLDSRSDDLYVMREDDGSYKVSHDSKLLSKSVLVQPFGSDDYCMLPFNRYISSNDTSVLEYIVDYAGGVCTLTPFTYPDEIRLLTNGNGVFIPLDGFYEKIKREVEGGKELVTVRFYDKEPIIEFLK